MTDLRIDRTTPTTKDPKTTGGDWQRAALIVGGVMFAIGNLLHPLEHGDAAYHSATWKAAHLLIFFSLPFIVVGLPFLHRRLTTRISPRLATVAVVASVFGLFGIAPGTIIETFVAPMFGHHAMEELESGGLGVVNALGRLPGRHHRPRLGGPSRPAPSAGRGPRSSSAWWCCSPS